MTNGGTLLILISGASLIFMIDSVSSLSVPREKNESDSVCSTQACMRAANQTLERMDLSVNPCDDFYSFACGKYVKETKIPDDKDRVGVFMEIRDNVRDQLHSLLTENDDEKSIPSFNHAKKAYKMCMDESTIEKHGKEPLNSITEQLGGWPVVKGDQWNGESGWSWTDTIKKFQKIGFATNYIVDLSVQTDQQNSSTRKIYISQAALGLQRPFIIKGFDNEVVKAYYKYMVDVAVILGADRNRAERELKDSLTFEIQLANISLPDEEMRNYTALYNPRTLHEIQDKYPYIKWESYINDLLPSSLSVGEKETIVVVTPSYFEKLDKLLKETKPRTIANYMMWRITSYSLTFLTSDLRKRRSEYMAVITGKTQDEERWKECVESSENSVSIAVGAAYVRKYFQEDSKAAALDMVDKVREEYGLMLRKNEWMDYETREIAVKKLATMRSLIGYSDELLDDSKIEKFYENLKIDASNYLSFFLSINIFETDWAFKQLREPVVKNDWRTSMPPFIVNAFYAPDQNGIQIPAAILQGQFFSAERPRCMNFGAIGSVIGHEMTHGFDDEGRQFDKDGDLVDWWLPETSSNFLKRAKCMMNQYGNYTEPTTGLKLNGVLELGENIADNGGVKEAYLAYQKWAQQNEAEQKLPGLDYTPQQLFWISAAQNWCSVSRPETLKRLILTDPHAPERFRVLGPFSNRKEFASDFQCKEGSFMNPAKEKRCEVW